MGVTEKIQPACSRSTVLSTATGSTTIDPVAVRKMSDRIVHPTITARWKEKRLHHFLMDYESGRLSPAGRSGRLDAKLRRKSFFTKLHNLQIILNGPPPKSHGYLEGLIIAIQKAAQWRITWGGAPLFIVCATRG